MRSHDGSSGQALVESAIVFPVAIFFILGIVQLTLVQQTRLMLEYAAFNAARAGAVWNGDPAKMEDAAILSLLPTMPRLPVDPLPLRVDEPQLLVGRWAVVKAGNALGGALGEKMIGVETLNPTLDDFPGETREIDFDSVGDELEARRKSQLTIRLTYFYPLRIPIIGKFFFETWLAGLAGLGLKGFDPFRPTLENVPGSSSLGVRLLAEGAQAKTNCKFSGITRDGVLGLAALGQATGTYYLPLVTTYTIRMQSNFFRKFATAKPECK